MIYLILKKNRRNWFIKVLRSKLFLLDKMNFNRKKIIDDLFVFIYFLKFDLPDPRRIGTLAVAEIFIKSRIDNVLFVYHDLSAFSSY